MELQVLISGWLYMLTRNDQPVGFGFNFATESANLNFAVDSVFVSANSQMSIPLPPSGDFFLLSDGSDFLLSDGTNLLIVS